MWSVNTWKIKSSRFGSRHTFWLIFSPQTPKHMHTHMLASWNSGVYCWIEVSGPRGTSFPTGSSVGAFVLSRLSPVWHVSVALANSAGLCDFHMCIQAWSSRWVGKNVLCTSGDRQNPVAGSVANISGLRLLNATLCKVWWTTVIKWVFVSICCVRVYVCMHAG